MELKDGFKRMDLKKILFLRALRGRKEKGYYE